MSADNQLVFYQQWAVAGQQVDKYSTQPWCVDSKNLDIFSDSQSVRGTAWTPKVEIPNVDYVDKDEQWRFFLYSDWRVWDSQEDVWYDHEFYDHNAQNVDWRDLGISWVQSFWTPRKLFVKYNNSDWDMIVIITDNVVYYIPNRWIHKKMTLMNLSNSTSDTSINWTWTSFRVKVWTSGKSGSFNVHPWRWWGRVKFTYEPSSYASFTAGTLHTNQSAYLYRNSNTSALSGWGSISQYSLGSFTYDLATKKYTITAHSSDTWRWDIFVNDQWQLEVQTFLSTYYWANFSSYEKWVYFGATPDNDNGYIVANGSWTKEFWDYLPPFENRWIKQIDDKWYMQVSENEYQEMEWLKEYDEDGNAYYTLITTWSFTLPEWYDIVAITKTFDYRLVFVNREEYEMWYVYLVPAGDDILNFQQAWEFPWLFFVNAVMINGYSYVIAEERGIRGLYIFSNWQTKKIAWADLKYTEWESIIDWKQIYDFTWPMLNWRGRVVAPTKNWIYMYWENKWWQSVGAFILKVDWEITEMSASKNQLKVNFTEWDKAYYKIYQDDVNERTFEDKWSITFPVQIGTHFIEKEVRDLEISYDLPNKDTKLEAFISVNDYLFRTFTLAEELELEEWAEATMVWCAGDYKLIFVEKNGNEYTFRLQWDMPYQISTTKQLLIGEDTVDYTEMNHFKKIWECLKDNVYMKEWKNRIFKITNENELPTVRKMQIRVDWTTDWHISPLLYSLKLLSDQIDK